MISDTIFEAEQEIEQYLGDDTYERELREAIVGLLAHMKAVRALPGMDAPPQTTWEAVHQAVNAPKGSPWTQYGRCSKMARLLPAIGIAK